jgi:hypothetical protein
MKQEQTKERKQQLCKNLSGRPSVLVSVNIVDSKQCTMHLSDFQWASAAAAGGGEIWLRRLT